jgi:hypothetical protein
MQVTQKKNSKTPRSVVFRRSLALWKEWRHYLLTVLSAIFNMSRLVYSRMPRSSSNKYVKQPLGFLADGRSISGSLQPCSKALGSSISRTLGTNQSIAPTSGPSPVVGPEQAMVGPNLSDLVSCFNSLMWSHVGLLQTVWLPDDSILPDNPLLDDAYWSVITIGRPFGFPLIPHDFSGSFNDN